MRNSLENYIKANNCRNLGGKVAFWYCAELILQQLIDPDGDTQCGKQSGDLVATTASSVLLITNSIEFLILSKSQWKALLRGLENPGKCGGESSCH